MRITYLIFLWLISEPSEIQIKRIFCLARQSEDSLFSHDIGNKKLLFHASHVNNTALKFNQKRFQKTD